MREKGYYVILKQHVPPDTWVAFVEELIQEISQKKRWRDEELIAGIFITEGWTERLMELVCNSPDLRTIGKYETHLSGKYSVEVVDLYSQCSSCIRENQCGKKPLQGGLQVSSESDQAWCKRESKRSDSIFQDSIS
jgi:hypothetical protein